MLFLLNKKFRVNLVLLFCRNGKNSNIWISLAVLSEFLLCCKQLLENSVLLFAKGTENMWTHKTTEV